MQFYKNVIQNLIIPRGRNKRLLVEKRCSLKRLAGAVENTTSRKKTAEKNRNSLVLLAQSIIMGIWVQAQYCP